MVRSHLFCCIFLVPWHIEMNKRTIMQIAIQLPYRISSFCICLYIHIDAPTWLQNLSACIALRYKYIFIDIDGRRFQSGKIIPNLDSSIPQWNSFGDTFKSEALLFPNYSLVGYHFHLWWDKVSIRVKVYPIGIKVYPNWGSLGYNEPHKVSIISAARQTLSDWKL